MASNARKRRKRRGRDYQAPPGRGAAVSPELEEDAVAAPARPRRRRSPRQRPPAPAGAFPLVELVVLHALVLLIGGFFVQGVRGVTMLGAGVALASLAGLELSIREHFAGYKSHTTVLAGAVAVLVVAIGFIVNKEQPSRVGLVLGGVAFLVAFYLFREAFKRRSGGFGFR
jgi:hypothetical protein